MLRNTQYAIRQNKRIIQPMQVQMIRAFMAIALPQEVTAVLAQLSHTFAQQIPDKMTEAVLDQNPEDGPVAADSSDVTVDAQDWQHGYVRLSSGGVYFNFFSN